MLALYLSRKAVFSENILCVAVCGYYMAYFSNQWEAMCSLHDWLAGCCRKEEYIVWLWLFLFGVAWHLCISSSMRPRPLSSYKPRLSVTSSHYVSFPSLWLHEKALSLYPSPNRGKHGIVQWLGSWRAAYGSGIISVMSLWGVWQMKLSHGMAAAQCLPSVTFSQATWHGMYGMKNCSKTQAAPPSQPLLSQQQPVSQPQHGMSLSISLLISCVASHVFFLETGAVRQAGVWHFALALFAHTHTFGIFHFGDLGMPNVSCSYICSA